MGLAKTAAKERSASTPKKAANPVPAPVVSPAAEHVAFQLISAPSPTREEKEANDAAADAVTEGSPYGIIIEDGLPTGEGQINRTPFMARLAPAIESAADELLKPAGRAAKDCPYLGFWLSYYRDKSAAHIERAIARHVRPQQTDLAGIEDAILAQVREAVSAWVDHRAIQVPGEIDWRVDDDRVPDAPGEGAVAQRMGADGHGAPAAPGSAAAIRGQLSPGRPLESGVRGRMERAFGTNFSDVRLHTDSTASRIAQQYSARAFTVGNNIAFGSGQYQPSTLAGQALMAHELAHVLQQRGASRDEGVAESVALESAANTAAAGALLSRSSQVAVDSGLRLARCSSVDVEPRDWTTEVPAEAFTKAERLQLLQRERERLLNQPGGNSQTSLRLAELDNEIAQLAEELQALGLQGDIGQVTQTAAQYGINALEVFITSLSGDSSTNLVWGERRRFDVDVSFLPSNVDVDVTWKANNSRSDLDVGHNNQRNLALTLDEMFWARWLMAEHRLRDDGTLPSPQTMVMVAQLNVAGRANVSEKRSRPMTIVEAIPPANQLQLLAENVLSSGPPEGRPLDPAATHPPPVASTSSISASGFGSSSSSGAAGGVPAPQTAATPPPPAIPQVLQNAHMFFKLSWLAPGDFGRTPSYVIRWGVENLNWTRPDRYQVSLPDLGFWRCEFRFPDTGRYRVFAEIYQYPFTSATPPLLASASSSVQVLAASEVGARALEALTAGPALPEYSGFVTELDAQINALLRVLAAGSSNPDLYSKQVSDLRKMRELLVSAMGEDAALPFPQDDTFDESKTYAAAMPAVLTHTDMRGAQPLTIYIRLRHSDSGWQARLIDTTSKDVTYRTGSPSTSPKNAVASAIASWRGENDYPRGGRVNYRFPRQAWGLADDFSTSSTKKTLLAFLDAVIFIASAIIGTILLLVPEPTGLTKAIGLGLLAVSVLRSAYAIYHNIDMGRPVLSQENALEGISILASLVGMRGGMMAARAATAMKAGTVTARVLTTFRVGRGMVIASTLADAGTFVYVSIDTLRELQRRANDPSLNPDQRDDEILRAIGQIALQGVLLIGSNRDLFRRPAGSGPRAAGGVVGALGGEVHLDPTQRSQMIAEIRQQGVHEDLGHLSDGDLARRYVDARQAYEVATSEAAAAPHGAVAGTNVYPMSPTRNISGPITIRNAFGRAAGPVRRMPGVHQYDVVLGPARTPETHLEIPVRRADGSTVTVRAEVRFNLVDDISTIPGAHGTESGPARLAAPTRDATGAWSVEVTVDNRLGTAGNTPETIQQVVGHELDEAAGIIRRVETDPAATVDIPAQMQRGVFRPGPTGGVPTDHDVAAAHELTGKLNNYRPAFDGADAAARGGTPLTTAQRARVVEGERSMNALLESMGFRDPATRPQKLLGLQAALGTVPPELLRYIDHYGRMIEAQTVHAGYRGSPEFAATSLAATNITPGLIDHLIHPNAERGILLVAGARDFPAQGIAGGHLEPALYDYVASQTVTTAGGNTRPQYQVSVVKRKTAGGNTYTMHAQFQRDAGSVAAAPPRDMTATPVTVGPTGNLVGVPYHPGWVTARPPKTTASNLQGMLASLDSAFANWLASPAGTAFAAGTSNTVLIGQVGSTPSMTGLHGVEFGGQVSRVNGVPTLTSAWIEASWF